MRYARSLLRIALLFGPAVGPAARAQGTPHDTSAAAPQPAAPQPAAPRAAPAESLAVTLPLWLDPDWVVLAPARVAVPPSGATLFGPGGTLGFHIDSRIETRLARDRNERCVTTDYLNPIGGCHAGFQPQFGFQFAMQSSGVVADRLHVDIDYDSQREFDASNRIALDYIGKPGDILQRVDVGNVTFTPPPSHFITASIPAGNYGIQAVAQIGPMNLRAIAAQQNGNVVRDRVFTVGGASTSQSLDREIADYQLERRRFFWVIDPRALFPSRYPNIDILDPNLASLAAEIPSALRPRRVLVYRYRSPGANGSTAPVINGPYAVTRYAHTRSAIGPYEVLQQGVDYYIDPTNLWICLVDPLGDDERLAVSYTVTGPDGREKIVGGVGGTLPTQRGAPGRDTVNLLWDNQMLPGDSAFDREIRSAYRLGGTDIDRRSVTVRVVSGTGSDQERPAAGTASTYLQLFGLAQRTNASAFDYQNRLWPRVADPNLALTMTAAPAAAPGTGAGIAGSGTGLIPEYFIILPSLTPFADSGLVHAPNPVNDSLYHVTDADLVSARRPPTQYRLVAHFAATGSGENGSLLLGSVQVRPGSERLFLDGRQLQRGVDYQVDYELGRVTFLHADTLFPEPRQVTVEYEENPLFTVAPTTMFGLAAQFATDYGPIAFTAISQSQQTQFNRPPLGFEPQASLLAGVTGDFTFDAPFLSRLVRAVSHDTASTRSSVNLQTEFATSRPTTNTKGVAYLETFEESAGIPVSLLESAWRYGSQPAITGAGVTVGGTSYAFPIDSATTLAWQNLGTFTDALTGTGGAVRFYPDQIDSSFVFIGGQTFRSPETVLWLDLYPPSVGGLLDAGGHYRWTLSSGGGRPWRSISQNLSPTGVDLSHAQQLQFWALVDTTTAARRHEPALVFDFGGISENSVYFGPDTLTISPVGTPPGVDSTYRGRRLEGADRVNTERDSVTQAFDVTRNDVGLPGDLADTLVVQDLVHGTMRTAARVPVCRRGAQPVLPLGDATADCTVGNLRLDENDLDRDGFLNLRTSQRNEESIVRFVADLSDPSIYAKVGRCYHSATDTSSSTSGPRPVCWVMVQLPFASPSQSLNAPALQRIQSVRITMVGGADRGVDDFTQVAIARLDLTGAPWAPRTSTAIAGIGGTTSDAPGAVIVSTIGTQDRNAANGLSYQSPPGVTDQPDSKGAVYSPGTVQVNEQSLRVVAVNVPLWHRAEAYVRFPEGDRNLMAYRALRIWARGRGKGWGTQGDLQFFVKLGRDADDFYLYRAPANAGPDAGAWLPEQVVDLRRFYTLRAEIENAYLENKPGIACHGTDSALVVASALPTTPGTTRYAACDSGYIVYTTNPAVTAPNLAAIQELAVGMVRVSANGLGTGGPITAADSLELWVDDIRLSDVVNDPGYAGRIGLDITAGDVARVSVSASRKDQNFRQFGEDPSFVSDDELDVASSMRLDKLLPASFGFAIPVSVSYAHSGGDPYFIPGTDLLASAIPNVRTPSTTTTSYTMSVRRTAPLQHSLLAPLVNNLVLTSTYVSASSRTAFQTGRSSAFDAELDWGVAPAPRTVHTPGWLRRAVDRLPRWLRDTPFFRSVRDADVRWNPTIVRVTSGYARSTDARASYLLPAAFAGDTARRVTGLENVWRNTGTIEIHPVRSLTARWDISSLRDLRDYGDTSVLGIIARGERERVLGVDVGLEREREMSTMLSATPPLTTWLHPRFDFSSTFAILRDPNAGTIVHASDSTGPYRLPRRMSNAQSLGVGATVDLLRAVGIAPRDSAPPTALERLLSPVDIQWRRDLRSIFDGVGFDPSAGYQLGLGGEGAFRSQDGIGATMATAARTLLITHSVLLPFGITVLDRYSRARTSAWTNLAGVQSTLTATQESFPDVSVRWAFTAPGFLQDVLTTAVTQAGARITHVRSLQPTTGDSTILPLGISTRQTLEQYPVSGTIAWSLLGGFTTDASWSHTDRQDVRSGGLLTGNEDDVSLDVAKAFTLPRSWSVRGNTLRTRLGYQRMHTQSFFADDTTRRRVVDNGRWAVTANADSDVSDTMSLSLLIARSLTYDNIYDRRFSQTVASVSFHLQFFSGDLR